MRMTFFRLAGCNVGRYVHHTTPKADTFPVLPTGIRAVECTSWDGRTFPCDTDFQRKQQLSVSTLIKEIPKGVEWISITGGEPFIHSHAALVAFCDAMRRKKIGYHIETSGTIAIPDAIYDTGCYIVCSPKKGYLPSVLLAADEIRLLVDKDFDVEAASKCLTADGEPKAVKTNNVFLSPISAKDDVMALDPVSLQRCVDLVTTIPLFNRARISIQTHKILGVR